METKKINYCIDCGQKIESKCKRCRNCYQIHIKIPQNHPNYKKGKPKCLLCGCLLSDYNTKICLKCHKIKVKIPQNNPNWKGGKPKCLDCGKILTLYRNKRCSICYNKFRTSRRSSNWKGGINKSYAKNKKCLNCGKLISNRAKHCIACFGKKHHFRMLGQNNHFYIHGQFNSPYPQIWNEVRNQIRKIYEGKCQICDREKVKEVHHIDYNKQNCKQTNLIVLCKSCHSKTNSNRDYWFAYCTYLKEIKSGK